MMTLLSILSIIGIIIFGTITITSFVLAIDDAEPVRFLFCVMSIIAMCFLFWTQCHDSTYKSTIIAISKENISKDKGVFTIKFFKDQDRKYKTSEYSEVKYLEYFDSNEFQKACIKYTQGIDVYGMPNDCGAISKIVPCDSSLVQ